MGRGGDAVAPLQHAVRLKPDIGDAWRLLGDHLAAMGDAAGADTAYANHIKTSTRDPRLLARQWRSARTGFRRRSDCSANTSSSTRPTSPPSAMLAEVAARLGRLVDAETLLERCLQLAPGFSAARHNYALVLHRQNRMEPALAENDRLLAEEPRNPGYRNLKAAMLNRIGEYGQSLAIYTEVLEEYPKQAKVWMSYGHALKTWGR